MDKNRKTKDAQQTLEPISQISEFEAESGSILEQSQKEADRLILEAKEKAALIIQKEKGSVPVIEKEYLDKMEKELAVEKERLIQNSQEELERIKNISEDKIRRAVDYILKRCLPL